MQSLKLERTAHTCVDCGDRSPQTETGYALMSARHGWRLSPRQDPKGERVVEWRCPLCWRAHRERARSA
jgi:hypothetical protein